MLFPVRLRKLSSDWQPLTNTMFIQPVGGVSRFIVKAVRPAAATQGLHTLPPLLWALAIHHRKSIKMKENKKKHNRPPLIFTCFMLKFKQ